MKTWKIPVCWSMMGTVCVEADTLEEAVEIAKDDEGVIPIPDNGSFLDGSWEVDCVDIDYLRQYYNGNQTDNIVATGKPYEAIEDMLVEKDLRSTLHRH